MKIFMVLVAIGLAIVLHPARAHCMDKVEIDKVAHFGIGGVISAMIYNNIFEHKRLGKTKSFFVSAIAGFLKEVYDARTSNIPGKRFDWKDMVATDVGGFVVLIKF